MQGFLADLAFAQLFRSRAFEKPTKNQLFLRKNSINCPTFLGAYLLKATQQRGQWVFRGASSVVFEGPKPVNVEKSCQNHHDF